MQTRKNINNQFLRLFVPPAVAFGLIVAYFYSTGVQRQRAVREANEVLHVNLGKQAIEKDLEAAVVDLRVLSQHGEFDKIDAAPNSEALKRLAREFLVFAQNKRHYDQIRFLGETGKEIIRVDAGSGHPAVVPEDRLQDKSRRYYFKDAMRLKEGEIFISPLDLNLEHGRVERPLKPVIRLVTPVFYGQAKKRGVVVLNYLGSSLIQGFKAAATGIADRAILLDATGSWRYSPRTELEWGSRLGHGPTFKKQFPDAWRQITDADAGRFYNGDGLFTFATLYPLRDVWESNAGATATDEPSRGEVKGKEDYWKVVAYVPGRDLDIAATSVAVRLLLIAAPLFGLLVAGAGWLAQARVRRMEAEEALTKRVRQQAAVAELGQRALSGVGLAGLLDTIVEYTAQVMEVEYCKILELLHGGETLLLRAGFGWQEGLVGQVILGTGMDSQAGYTLACHDAVIVEDLRQEARFTGPPLLYDHGVVSGMSIIIHGVNRPFGVFSVHTCKRRTFTKDDVNFVQAVANIISEVIELEFTQGQIVHQAAVLRVSQERFAQAVRGTNDGIWDWDLFSGEIYFSPRWKEMLGFKQDEIKDNFIAWRDLVHPDDLGHFLMTWTAYLDGEVDSFTLEYRIRTKPGNYTWVICRGLASNDAEGRPVRLSGSQTDISERHRANTRLHLQAAALEAAADSIVITDRDGGIQWVNPAYTRLTGYELDEVHGKNPRILKSGKQDPAFYKRLWDTILSGKTWYGEVYNKCKDGSLYLEEESITPVMDEQGQISHFVAIKRDVTERQQLQKQLQQAQKMESIGQLTGGIAHDFNNMLAAILGYTELAIEESAQYENEQTTRYLVEVQKSGQRARDLVAQMLAFSRGGEGELRSNVLSPLIKESLKMLGSTLPSSIEIDLQPVDDELTVMTNPVQLHQLIMNLCINARDAMEGKGHISIGIQRVNSVVTDCRSCHERLSGDYITLFVRDTGPGIKPEQLDRIFDPFYTTKMVGKGTGMGLSMVHGIMHDHGGHIVVETGLGQGTTFTLLFPIIDDRIDTVNIEDVDANASSNQLFYGNILIVDDEASVGRFIGELLTGRGCQVTVETDSRSALSRFKGSPAAFDLLVTDQTMPGMTGAELAQSLMLIQPELPVILCTGYSEHIDEARARSLGIRGYVNKPIETDEFLKLVQELLQARRIQPEGVAARRVSG